MTLPPNLTKEQCQQARAARDPRFDGKFYIGVITTKIYCRPICPVRLPNEANVIYFHSPQQAASQGFRPCLRCHPDSAPGSYTWKGIDTSIDRALNLIEQGALIHGTVTNLAERLGISVRYLRHIFNRHLGVSPKQYALYQQLLFAKQLLHQTSLPITEVALASGFHSIRRFNDCFKQQLQVTPSQIRQISDHTPQHLRLWLSYRPPYRWDLMQQFFAKRLIKELEWIDEQSYGRSFCWTSSDANPTIGEFTAIHHPQKWCFEVRIALHSGQLSLPMVRNIRRILDLDSDMAVIDQQLSGLPIIGASIITGLRLPGVWNSFEAGIRAILGQQISVNAATRLVNQLVQHYGQKIEINGQQRRLFPTPAQLHNLDFSELKMPQQRRNTLQQLSCFCLNNPNITDLDAWLAIKGIGPWTVNYAKMRGQSDADIWLASDLGIIKALQQLAPEQNIQVFDPKLAAPWRSYLTFQCWNLG